MIQQQQKFPRHHLWIIPEVNFSQAVLISGLRKHKAREAKTLTPVGEGNVFLRFSQKHKMHLPNYKPLKFTSMLLLPFLAAVVSWRRAAVLTRGAHHHANVNSKRSMKLYSFQDTFPTTENAGYQSSSAQPGFLFLTYNHHFTSYF